MWLNAKLVILLLLRSSHNPLLVNKGPGSIKTVYHTIIKNNVHVRIDRVINREEEAFTYRTYDLDEHGGRGGVSVSLQPARRLAAVRLL